MDISTAIDILKELSHPQAIENFPGDAEAIKLGINALIFYRKLKASNTGEIQGGFLGETPEENPLPRLAAALDHGPNKKET